MLGRQLLKDYGSVVGEGLLGEELEEGMEEKQESEMPPGIWLGSQPRVLFSKTLSTKEQRMV